MTHLLAITLNHYGQFLDTLRRRFPTMKTIQPVNYREHPDHKINADIHPHIITELTNKQYSILNMCLGTFVTDPGNCFP